MDDGNIGYLLHRISFGLNYRSNSILKKQLNIGFSQFKILLVLLGRNKCSQKDIASALTQSEASISRQVKKMTKLGLLEPELNLSDRRTKHTGLTKKGKRLCERGLIYLNDYYQPMFNHLSYKERSDLYKSLIELKNLL